jgi:hypothetical protein
VSAMHIGKRRRRLSDGLWLGFWFVASALWCVSAAPRLGATFDEPFYLQAGLEAWRTGSHQALLKKGTMPLPPDLQTLPLFVAERWQGASWSLESDFASALRWARATTLVFWGLLLWFGFLAAREIAGVWGGRLAVALLASEVSLLAHAGLATTDVALAAALLMLTYAFRAGRDRAWGRRVALPMLCYAVALLAKASALVLGPVCLLVTEIERLWRAQAFRRSGISAALSPFVRDAAWIVPGGLLAAFVFCGTDWEALPSFRAWAQTLPDDGFGRVMTWLADHLRIFSNAGEALVKQVRHNFRGHGVYLLGHTDARALWYYFPVLLTIKLGEPLLLAPLLLLLLRPRALLNWAFLVFAVMIALSLTLRVQLGVRMVLPAVVFLVVGLAAATANAAQASAPRLRRWIALAAAVAVGWNGVAAAAAWPQGLLYVNRFWGGSRDGFLLVSDSNYDWGQGLPDLARWAHAAQVPALHVWYFGTDPRIDEPPFEAMPLHQLPIMMPDDTMAYVRGRVVAVSTTLLFGKGSPTPAALEHAAAFFRGRQPVERTATFLVYDFREEGPR